METTKFSKNKMIVQQNNKSRSTTPDLWLVAMRQITTIMIKT